AIPYEHVVRHRCSSSTSGFTAIVAGNYSTPPRGQLCKTGAGMPTKHMRNGLLAAALLAVAAVPAIAETTLRFIPQADLRVLDPIWTTAYVTRNHGYMIYDTLFGTDADLKPQPEMVERWEASPDK